MTETNPYAPPVDAASIARSKADHVHLAIHCLLMVLLAAFGGLVLATLAFKALGYIPTTAESLPNTEAEAFGFVIGRTYSVGSSLAALVWGPINIYGLLARRPWAPRSTHKYWIAMLFTCVCAPFAIYGIVTSGRLVLERRGSAPLT